MANGGEACDADRAGAVRWHAGAGQFQVCYGSGGWAKLSDASTSGTILVTALDDLSDAATEYNTSYTVFLGSGAGSSSKGNYVTGVGINAAYQNSGSNVTGLGHAAAYQNSGTNVTGVGYYATLQNTGANVTGLGYAAARSNSGADVTGLGHAAAYSNTGATVTGVGVSAAAQNSGNYVTALGYAAAYQNTAANVVAIGYEAGRANTVANQFIVKQNTVNSMPLMQGDFSTGRLGIGTTSPSVNLHISGTIRISNGGEACDANRAGAVRWHEGSGQFQVCYGSGGWALLSSAAVSGTLGTTPDRIVSGTSSVIAAQDRSLTITTAGSEVLTVGEDGRVGIGVSTSMLARLNFSNSLEPKIQLWSYGGGSIYSFGVSGGKLNYHVASSSDAHVFYATGSNGNGTELMRIRGSGSVGIGTSTPATSLTVVGEVQVSNSGVSCATNTQGAIRYAAGNLQYCNGTAFTALASATELSNVSVDRIVSGTSSVIASQDRSVTISTAGTERLVVGENGYVGVGTSTPSATLEVQGSLQVGNSASAGNFQVPDLTGNSSFRVVTDWGESQRTAIVNNWGNSLNPGVMIGTTRPDGVALRVASSIPLSSGLPSGGGTARMVVLGNGNVGISTTTPSETLTVNGNADVSGTVKVAGTGAESCTMGTLGQIRLNPTSGKFEVCRQ